MKYLIDTANFQEIKNALKLGIEGITANPSMYLKEKVNFYQFLKDSNSLNPNVLTAEVIGDNIEDMLNQVEEILNINKDIIIKINFSKLGLELINILNKRNIKTACTLIFNVNQASLAINAGVDYIFAFVGRNDENGYDGIENIKEICDFIKINNYKTKVIAASLKNVYHLKKSALCGVNYCAITYSLLEKIFDNKLTLDGEKVFNEDFAKI